MTPTAPAIQYHSTPKILNVSALAALAFEVFSGIVGIADDEERPWMISCNVDGVSCGYFDAIFD